MTITDYVNKLNVHDKWRALMEKLYHDDDFLIELLDGIPETNLEDLVENIGSRVSVEIKKSTIPFTLEVGQESADLHLHMLGGHVKPGMLDFCKKWIKEANHQAFYGFFWQIQHEEFLVLKNVVSMITSLSTEEFVETIMELIDYASEMVIEVHR